MADIPINPVTRRVEFTGNTGTGPFAFTFNVLAQADIAAYKNNTLLALTSDYTVSLNSNGTGSITLVAALIASDELVIIGDLPLSRTTDFVTAGDLLASSLNQQFDSNVVMSQQLDERFDRTIRSQPGDINKNLYLPLVSSRASQLLSFDSSGNITTTSLANVPDIGTVNLSVSGVASFADGSASAPSITNIGDTNTGMYFGAADQINFSIGGSEVISVASTGTTISGLSISSGDILLTDNSATALEIKEGSNNYLTFITTNGSEKLSFGSTANPTFEVNGSFRQPLIAATTSFFSQTYSGATLSATNGSVNIESYSASKAGIVLNGSGDQITFTSPTLGFVGLVQVVGAITTNTSLNIASSTTVDGILDEDDMASNSATKLATQQSIKAYVDAQVGTVDTLAEVLGNGNTTGSNNIIVTAGQSITVDTISETTAANGVVIDGVTLKDGGATVTADVSFGDNDKATFGAGSDLQIYHDGLASYIVDQGAGNIKYRAADRHQFENADGSKLYMQLVGDTVGQEYVQLRYNNDTKFATTSTGVDITGTLVSDGLTVDGDAVINDTIPQLQLMESDTTDVNSVIKTTAGQFRIQTINDAANSTTNRFIIDHATGDISLYEDTGTTAKFFWDASAESLGIGTSLPSYPVTIHKTGDGIKFEVSDTVDANYRIQVSGNDIITGPSTASDYIFQTGNTERMRIDSIGNVGIGTDAPSAKLSVTGLAMNSASSGVELEGTWPWLKFKDTESNQDSWLQYIDASNFIVKQIAYADRNSAPSTVGTERMRIDSSGNLLVGTTSSTGGGRLELKGSGTGAYVPTGYNGNNVNSVRIVSGGSPSTSDTVGISMGIGGGAEGYFGIVQDSSGYANFVFNSYNGSYAERMRIDSSGNVGIGTDAPASVLHVSDTTQPKITIEDSTNNSFGRITGGGSTGSLTLEADYNNAKAGTVMAFNVDNAEAMRIDSSGNLLVGKPSSSFSTAGIELQSDAELVVTRNGSTASFNRLSSGNIVDFYASGSPVGSIGSQGGDSLTIGNGDTGLLISAANDVVHPWNTSTNAARDNAIDLGRSSHRFKDLYLSGSAYTPVVQGLGDEAGLTFGGALVAPRKNNAAADGTVDLGASSARFKDLYLSGGVYLGGTGAAHKLDDYEEGTWTPFIAGVTPADITGCFTKIGDLCYIGGFVNFGSTSDTTPIRIDNFPFTCSSDNDARAGLCISYSTRTTFTSILMNNATSTANLRNLGGTIPTNADFSGKVIHFGGVYKTA